MLLILLQKCKTVSIAMLHFQNIKLSHYEKWKEIDAYLIFLSYQSVRTLEGRSVIAYEKAQAFT